MASAWNLFVKKIYWENKKKNANFQFKDALKEASRRKGEMGSSSATKSKKRGKSHKHGGSGSPPLVGSSIISGGRKRRGTRKRR
jgi:hypothetical protein